MRHKQVLERERGGKSTAYKKKGGNVVGEKTLPVARICLRNSGSQNRKRKITVYVLELVTWGFKRLY